MDETERTEFQPDHYIPPGEVLEETLEALGMTRLQLARRLGETLDTVNKLLSGEGYLTPILAQKLEEAIAVPASYWNNHERRWREYLAKQKTSNVA